MSNGTRLPFVYMNEIAKRLWHYLAPAVRRHDIAGSVRRHATDPHCPATATCGDIELVLDGDREAVIGLLNTKPKEFRHISGGTRLLKCEIHMPMKGRGVVIPVQLNFATTLESLLWNRVSNYGWKLLLATGDAAWNHLAVTDLRLGGFKPIHLHRVEARRPTTGFLHIDNDPCHTPDEASVFALYGIPFVPPHRRTEGTAREIREHLLGATNRLARVVAP